MHRGLDSKQYESILKEKLEEQKEMYAAKDKYIKARNLDKNELIGSDTELILKNLA
ncbi:MAG TPA: hypothetical protein VEP90_26805 [Methylomirabilota bacterium]|nr:hypothetical protein [Methylomirabilota bacterium]